MLNLKQSCSLILSLIHITVGIRIGLWQRHRFRVVVKLDEFADDTHLTKVAQIIHYNVQIEAVPIFLACAVRASVFCEIYELFMEIWTSWSIKSCWIYKIVVIEGNVPSGDKFNPLKHFEISLLVKTLLSNQSVP
ncbi:hypothetical protein NQ317_015749 [Molorchus minor]|uniref:Uncharacterized protein n=1 Tax=Molorchus minor TaxID=1323400 RepID=A0ABQ9K2M7_9CUCU|nr:hypothetical protein NQ317_015749 [Molorchus minor]